MPRGEAFLGVVRGWVAKAEADLGNARLVCAAGPTGPMDTVAFHAQQCAEKYLKALLCFNTEEVPRTHDVEALLERTELWGEIEISVEESRLLTAYATVTRYPGDYEPVSAEEAASAIELAERIRATVRRRLPRDIVEAD